MLKEFLRESGITKYRLSKISGVPYATISDLVNGKSNIMKCEAQTVYRIAQALGVSMEQLLSPCRTDFDLFRSNMCHEVKNLGDIVFLQDIYTKHRIEGYWNRNWMPECLYTLAMTDYLSRENDIPLYDGYEKLRQERLPEVIYPLGIQYRYLLCQDESILKNAYDQSIPEFKRFNIVESGVRDIA